MYQLSRDRFIYSPEVNLPSYQPTLDPNDMQIKILKQLPKAKKPVLLAGGGTEASKELNEFVANSSSH